MRPTSPPDAATTSELEDLFDTIAKWLPYVPPQFRPFVAVWVDVFNKHAAIPLSSASLRKIRGMMRRDVDAQKDFLRDASEKVLAAWVEWYPEWVGRLLAERAAEDPLFLLPADEHAKKRRELETRADTALKQSARERDLAARLFRHVHNAPTKQINWAPKKLASELSSTNGGRRIKPKKVTEAADALVRVDVAAWMTRASGQHWALTTDVCDQQRSVELH